MSRVSFAFVVATFILLTGRAAAEDAAALSPADVFDLRIMPIFRSPEPSSCVQCHLSAVDLKDYILPSHERTFLSLRDQGLIDLDNPENSKILTLIRMGDNGDSRPPGAKLIHQRMRAAEYAAFRAWIEACCGDAKLRGAPPLAPQDRARPERPDEVIRHARYSRVVDSFVRHVWSQRMRCFPCHTPHEIDQSDPRQQAALKTQQEIEAQIDPRLLPRLPIFRATPEETLDYLIRASRAAPPGELPLINLADPRQSLLVLKPTSQVPAKDASGKLVTPAPGEPLTHAGGIKMHPDDQSYKSFLAWIADYAGVVGGRYKSVDELPADNWFGSQLVLRLGAAPEEWPIGAPVQLFVYAYDDERGAWAAEPIAFTQGTVTPQRFVNGMLFLLGSPDRASAATWDAEHSKLPRGDYLVKAYVDAAGRLADAPTLLLGEQEFAGQTELKSARWREGFRQAETVFGTSLKGR